jgi:hypothetical protein
MATQADPDQPIIDDQLLALALQLEEVELGDAQGGDATIALEAYKQEIATTFALRRDQILAQNIGEVSNADDAVNQEIDKVNSTAEHHKRVARQIRSGHEESIECKNAISCFSNVRSTNETSGNVLSLLKSMRFKRGYHNTVRASLLPGVYERSLHPRHQG